MSVLSWCHWLQNTPWALALRQSDFFFPVIEGSHILALSISVGLILLLDLRLLRLILPSERVSKIMSQVMPWALPGFGIMFVTGLLLFFAQAEKVYTNGYFRVKMLVLVLVGINALIYQLKFYPAMAEWDLSESVPRGAQVIAAVSLAFWMIVIACGRLMAYEL
jgi:hypothetical protein